MMIGNTTGDGLLSHFYHILKKYDMLNIKNPFTYFIIN